MKKPSTLHVALAAVGLASLLVYVLACSTSFSPDDSQVLYPAFDQPSGAVSIAVYDRKTGRSENIFTAYAPDEGTNREALLTRAQWLPDGKHVLIAHIVPGSTKTLSFFVVPRGVNESIRHLCNLDVKEPAVTLEFPFCVVGTKILLRDEHRLGSIDFMTGQISSAENTNKVWPLPGGDAKTIGAAAELEEDAGMAFGTIDPQTLAFKPVLALTNEFKNGAFPAFDPRTGEVVFVTGEKTNLQIQVVKSSQVKFSRAVERAGAELMLGPWLDLGPRNDRVFTTYISHVADAANAEYGVVEIPLNRDPLRWTPLFHAKPGDSEDLLFAQASLSHDGQTWAIATSYLYLQSESFKAEDCALYLVEVGQAKPKITKVPITPPLNRGKLTK